MSPGRPLPSFHDEEGFEPTVPDELMHGEAAVSERVPPTVVQRNASAPPHTRTQPLAAQTQPLLAHPRPHARPRSEVPTERKRSHGRRGPITMSRRGAQVTGAVAAGIALGAAFGCLIATLAWTFGN